MSRIIAREAAYKLIFEYLFSKEINKYTFEIFNAGGLSEEDSAYLQDVYLGTVQHYDELLDIVSKYSAGFEVDRIYKTDLAALLVAIYEIKYMPDIPVAVTISEVVSIVKTYSTEKSGSFVNGLLAAVAREYGVNKNDN